ncbi:H-NS family nucleoid-associated regulatory protein [Aggregatibacter actinomycetemcomitans]|uniref:H-NS family histone-like protein n=1 Tax=Aggregatibacter actinomycetemcomitans TaxID=714 RepID=UPI00068139A3|nr:H-NS family nucleoid-associated regulatory protein [Aggregatibacter actinomycetemcomitans]TQE41062.1 DNA-binding protein H-NS-like protein [Aggregatibacter actinomycetemcomitans]
MSDVLKILTNIRSLRMVARDLALEQLESILEKLQLVVTEKKEDILKAQQEENERQERIAKYKELLKQEGITADELAEILGSDAVRKKRDTRPAKYQYVDEKGVTKTWTGQGRTPKAIQAQLDKGKSLSSFKI